MQGERKKPAPVAEEELNRAKQEVTSTSQRGVYQLLVESVCESADRSGSCEPQVGLGEAHERLGTSTHDPSHPFASRTVLVHRLTHMLSTDHTHIDVQDYVRRWLAGRVPELDLRADQIDPRNPLPPEQQKFENLRCRRPAMRQSNHLWRQVFAEDVAMSGYRDDSIHSIFSRRVCMPQRQHVLLSHDLHCPRLQFYVHSRKPSPSC